jgi:signal transduction histidine kinase
MRESLRLRTSLTTRMALVYGLISALVVAVMGLGIYYWTARYLTKQAVDDLSTMADFYAVYASATAADQTRLLTLAPQIVGFFAPQSGYDVRLFGGRNGALLAATRDIGELPSHATAAELSRQRPTLFFVTSYDQPDRLYAARPVTAADGTAMAVVEVSRDASDLAFFLDTLRLGLAGAGALALVAAAVTSLLLTPQLTRPLREMESATQSIASGDFGRRLTIASHDEIGRLAASINQMATNLARLEAARREFIARVSHDLRTPLTAIKGSVVNLQDTAPEEMQASLAMMDEQTDRLIRLVNDLLALSRLQRGELHLQRVEANLTDVAHSAISLADAKAKRLGVTLNLALPEAIPPIRLDADRLQQVIVNLLDNALRETPAGGTVEVQIASEKEWITLTVSDDGRGPTAEEERRAFEPYFHGPGGGAGLGLTIAREIIAAHGGEIWLRAQPSGGAEVGFTLPTQ